MANGGTLYAPRLVSELRDPATCAARTAPEVPLRRVMSEPLAALLREAMGRVVGRNRPGHAPDWIDVGGKTGTAQKSRDGRVTRRAPTWPALPAIVPWKIPAW